MKKIIGNLQKLSPAIMAAAAGLFLFWVLESAICRRIDIDLFLPVQAGALLPGRIARLGTALVL